MNIFRTFEGFSVFWTLEGLNKDFWNYAYPLKKRKQCIRKENVITGSYTEVDPCRLKGVPQSTDETTDNPIHPMAPTIGKTLVTLTASKWSRRFGTKF